MMKTRILICLCLIWLVSGSISNGEMLGMGTPYHSHLSDVVVIGDYAYCAMYKGLLISDISAPSAPVVLSHIIQPTRYPKDLKIYGNYAYVIDYDFLISIDISNPSSPFITSTIDFSGYPREMAIEGSNLYIANWNDGVTIYDLSDPAHPSFINSYDMFTSSVEGIVVEYPYAYMAAGSMGLVIHDISDPSNPVEIANYSYSPNGTRFVVKSGDVLFMNISYDQVAVMDVADPYNPQLISMAAVPNALDRMDVEGNYLFTSDNTDGTQIVDISNLDDLQIVGTINNISGAPEAIGSNLYILRGEGYYIYDLTDPANPNYIGKEQAPFISRDIAVSNGTAVAVGEEITVSDVADPYNADLASIIRQGYGSAVKIRDNYAYVVGNDTTLRIFDIADPYNPVLTGNAPGFTYAYDIVIDGNYAYASYYYHNLAVYDVSDPYAPFLVGTFEEFWGSKPLAVFDHYLFLGGMHIIDISDPYSPIEVGFVGTCATPTDVIIRDTLAFLSYGDSELFNGRLGIVSIADPTNPYIVSCTNTENEAHTIAIHGDIAYVGEYYGGIRSFDISNPASPIELGYYGFPAFAMELEWPFLYVINEERFRIFTFETICGDANFDGVCNVGDVITIINYVFKGGPPPPGDGDANCDGGINVGDAIYIVNYVFNGGAAPCANCP